MTRRLVVLVSALVALVGASVWLTAQSDRSPLEGVWTVEDVSYPGEVNNPTGLVIFSGRHHSISFLRVTGRQGWGAGGAATASADQLRAVWGPFNANAGTFEVSGERLTVHPTVAKNTFPMASGAFVERSFTLSGDTLTMTTVGSNSGPATNAVTLRLRRVR